MFEPIPLESTFLTKYLVKYNTLHFFDPQGNASLFLRVDELGDFEQGVVNYWFSFSQTGFAPVISLNIELTGPNGKEVTIAFIYNIKETDHLDELHDMIQQREVMLNVVAFQKNDLYFGYSYILHLQDQMVEEMKRIILQAKEFTRKMVSDYDFHKALVLFERKEAIFKQKTQTLSRGEFFLPQYQEEEDDSVPQGETEAKEPEESEQPFTYSGTHDETYVTTGSNEHGDPMVIQTYSRDEYERIKTGELSGEHQVIALRERIKTLDAILSEKSRENAQLKSENKFLREELDYLKLDQGKRNWWPFNKNNL